ncbi:hypothetical protein N0V95_003349 [Ascochyta clinopodiicola]|nr:hypothetical protein N0V95_003349 [Ascochyta clinopodiicola]
MFPKTPLLEGKDVQDIWHQNQTVPESVDRCVHELIKTTAQGNPAASAIHAWDGEMTYGELEEVSTRLACHLVGLGVGPGSIVPLCFEKSKWTVVAMLAVLKAGGAFTTLDPEHPRTRHEQILQQTRATMVLTSAQCLTLWETSAYAVLAVDKPTMEQLSVEAVENYRTVEPSKTVYVMFTSGSTGKPKGVVLEHRTVSTNCLGHGKAFGFTPHTRALQFASYTFDVCITEIITTLMFGGCVCIPSEDDRRDDLAKAINTMNVNWALLTPTVARVLVPSSVSTLETLVLGGEQVVHSDWKRWNDHVKVINTYGPTECSVWCTSHVGTHNFKSGLIGKPFASVSWVVDPQNHDKLAPAGSIGELLIEGPILARGYLSDTEKTKAAFINDPAWLLEGGGGYPGRHGRLYKTGDLVRYDSDSNLVYVGRKDNQVKVRGQRVELGEIEHHLRECMPEAKQLAVEVILLVGNKNTAMLAAFLQLEIELGNTLPTNGTFETSSLARVIFPVEASRKLAQRLPGYMVPDVYFAISQLPMTVSSKMDRKRLREIGASFSSKQLAEMRTSSESPKRAPSTEAEQTMQQLWAGVLNVTPDSIGLDDSFFRLGGDSITAMKLVGEARKYGMQLSVADLFRNPKLILFASLGYSSALNAVEEVPAFSLLAADVDAAQLREEVGISCNIDLSPVEDVYPCSPLQEGLMSLTSKRAGDYIMQSVLKLRDDVDKGAFRGAWEQVVQSTAVLRTRIVQHSKLGLLQAVIKEDIEWVQTEGLEAYLEKDKSASMELGEPLVRYALVGDKDTDKRWFVWTIHHALYDGWSLPRILDAVTKTYNGHEAEKQPGFNAFIKYLGQQDQEAAAAYWQAALADCEATPFPPLPPAVQQPVADAIAEHHCPALPKALSDTTTSTLIRAAWAIVASRYTSSDDVVFGATVMGRNAPVAGIEAMIGPTIATVPVRVRVRGEQMVSSFLESLQQQATEMMAHEQTGLQRIGKMGVGARHACSFQTLLVVQPAGDDLAGDGTLGEWRGGSEPQDFTTYALMLQCTLAAKGVHITASFDAQVVERWLVEKMLGQLSFVMQQLTAAGHEMKVNGIDLLTPEDKQQLWAWNGDVPLAVERCIHDLFAERAEAQPNAPAICAWDGELTYGELETLSTRLAGHLVDLGVKAEDIVPLCFEKSMWTVVAMLAVLKAGGAFVPLDPEHAASRHKKVIEQAGAKVVLASAQYTSLWVNVAREVATVSKATLNQLSAKAGEINPAASPGNAAYVIFTSGSTGVPKGVVLDHRAVSTSCLGHGKAFGFTSRTRTLQFASYTFDACIAEIITTLVFGGCVCVPSEDDRRNDLVNVINSMSVNLALPTPSVAQLLDPSSIPTLEILVLEGEQVSAADWERWMGHVQITNGYGPTECCVSCSAYCGDGFRSGVIGKSIASVSWVVDPEDHNQLVSLGSTGELLVEGPILARGYLNDAEKTQAAFINDPAWLLEGGGGYPGRHGRMYKTGDLVRYNADGDMVYVGRKDSQVKVRGQRVELGEIEHHLRECMPEAQQLAVEVILPAGVKANAMLAAFLQLEDGTDWSPPAVETTEAGRLVQTIFLVQVEKKLGERLPGYMVPDVYFAVAQLPTTVSGKTDRKRLREIGASFSAQQLAEMQVSSEGPKRVPSTEAERTMQQLWAGVLNVTPDSIGLDDSFFRLGGDSIAAMKLVGEARRAGMRLSVADLFRHPRLGQSISADVALTHDSPTAIPHTEHTGPVEQSFAQGRLWFLEQLHPGLTWYLMPFAVRIKGPLQLAALDSALLAIENRHEALRTTFATTEGISMQSVQPFCPKKLNVVDILQGDEQSLANAVQQDQATPFDLRTEPGWRASVYRVNQHDHVLSIVMHHIVSDGWSVDVLMRELGAFYSASICGQDPLSQVQPLPIQYGDFSVWQKQQARIDEHQRQLSYWLAQLQTSRPAELLCDKPRPATLSGNADTRTLEIEASLYARLQEFCKARGVTLFVVLLAAFRATHFRLTGQEDATIGTANANRDRWELKDVIGFFVNMQCLRITVGGESFEELVQQVQSVAVASLANQDVPFESIVSKLKNDRDLSRHPIVQLVFAVHSQRDLGQLVLEGVETEYLEGAATSRFDLEFHFFKDQGGLRGDVIFSTDLYAAETIDSMLSVFQNILKACLKEPKAVIASLLLSTEAEYTKLNRMGLVRVEETAYPRESSVVDLFRQQASAHPSRTAVKDASSDMSYAQLDKASDDLAQWLARRSFSPETLVGVFAGRSCETIVAFLGILKANLAYLPFDVNVPARRMEAILSSLPGQRVILTGADVQPPDVKLRNIEFVSITEALNEHFDDASEYRGAGMAVVGPSATSLVYVIFTSGSTGQPKGVMVEHRGIVRLVRDNNLVQHLPTSRVMAHMANLAFDVSTWEIYACLLNGGTLVCIEATTVLDTEAMVHVFSRCDIRMAVLTPALFRQYTQESPAILARLDMLCLGGEALHPRDFCAAERLLTGKVINCYGPTENTGISTVFVLHSKEQFTNGVPIGRALSNSGAYVMDSELQLVPLGVIGELVVTGDGLARGYTDSQRDIDRFVLVTVAGQTFKAYRTGDYVRHRPTDGQLEYFGRMDGQIKIRGQRVELGEIEHVLRSHKSVSDAVTVLQQRDSEVQLAGFVTVHERAAIVDEQLGNGDGDGEESQHVDTWEKQFDSDVYSPIGNVRPESIGRDFIGWTSMYDGSEIDKAEMNEWLDDTIDTMLNGRKPGKVLEIGSGTGMILFNLGDGLQSYVGLDPSRKAVEFVVETAKSIPALAGKVRLHKATAMDVGQLEQPMAANLVVMNSVVQYFPSQEYLFMIVQGLLKLKGARTLFFGDVRSYALHREFLAARALWMAGDKATKADIQRMMADMERVERELLVDPGFFTALPNRLPELVEHVEILPKKMKATNELSCYRYAAVVHVRLRDGQRQEIRHVEHDKWIDFAERKLDRQSLLQQLKSASGSSVVAVSNIPYSKTIVSRYLVHSLDHTNTDTLGSPSWLSSVYQQVRQCSALSATDLIELSKEVGCGVEISWNRQHSQRGGLDAIFHWCQPENKGNRVLFRFPTDHTDRPLHSLSSRPLRQRFLQKIQQQLQKMVEAQLPTYMVPQTITILDAMPVNQNGKVDRKTLEQRMQTQATSRESVQQPISEEERTMQQLWAGVLNVTPNSIGLDDSFFRLGGDSITAMKLVSAARKQGMQLSVADLFRNPKLISFASLDYSSALHVIKEAPAFSLLGDAVKATQVQEEVAAICGMDVYLVEDVYPCSPLQEGLMSLTSKRAGDYIMQSVLKLRDNVDKGAFRGAWEQVVQSTAVLRTRIVQHSKLGLLQAVIKEDIEWVQTEGLEAYLEKDKSASMELGEPLVRYALVGDKDTDKRWFVWTIHHALYDGWSLPRILDAVTKTYNGHEAEKQPGFNAFIKYLGQQDQEAAAAYWQAALADCEATLFPPLPSMVQQPVADTTVEYQYPALPRASSDTTTSTLIRAAWAIVANRYTSSEDVVFGAIVTGRNAPVAGIDVIAGPTIATVPVRLQMQCDWTVPTFLKAVQQQATEMIPHEQTGLQRIVKMGQGARHACNFQTLVVVQPADDELGPDKTLGEWCGHSRLQDFTTYALMLQCTLASDGVCVKASFDSRVLERWQVEKMLAQFSFVLEQLAAADRETRVVDVDTLTPEDKQQLWAWNSEVPAVVERCVHDLFTEQAVARPEAPAICAWDGELTYGELNELSTRLAGHLLSLGVKSEEVVPLCFEKSMWTVVAMLAVLKAGGAFLLLDPSSPTKRLQQMCRKVSSTLVLASQIYVPVVQSLAASFVVVSRDSTLQLPPCTSLGSLVQPTNTAYVIFTSGSTGEPKGCSIEHRSSSSAVVRHGPFVNMHTSTRTLQFGSYSFAGSLVEMILTLVHGGCVCIPSEEERRTGLASAISKMKINWAFLTPSVVESISPDSVPSLATLCIGGEQVRASQIQQWERQLHLRQTYGSSETSGVVSSTRLTSGSTTRDVGKASTGVYWIVDSSDPSKLAPVGAVGEVLVEGPVLGRGYVDELDKTNAMFISSPSWIRSFRQGQHLQRLYKTGDLGRYKQDGSIELLGRRDHQVKLRGQRIELGEIEHQARLSTPDLRDVAVELIASHADNTREPLLMGFFTVHRKPIGQTGSSDAEGEDDKRKQRVLEAVLDRLEKVLPQYMVLSILVPLAELPTTASQKTDRKRLREIGASFSAQQLAEMRTSGKELKRQPTTEAEQTMQQLWAGVLCLKPDNIGLDDSFFRLGGDSIAAMKLVAEARREGLQLTAADVFQYPRLVNLSCCSKDHTSRAVEDVAAFSLLAADVDAAQLREEVGISCNIDPSPVEDVYPCSPLQEGLMSLTSKRAGDYIMQSVLKLRDNVDKGAFRGAWEQVVQSTAVLRTRIVQHSKLGLLQAVIKEDIEWVQTEGLEAYLEKDKSASMELGEPLVRYALVGDKDTDKRWFVWTIHHALYDGWSLPRILDAVTKTYNGHEAEKQPGFNAFIKYLGQQDQEAAAAYWQAALADCKATLFPPLPSMVQQPVADTTVEYQYPALPRASSDTTTSTLIRAAWAIVANRYTSSEDVVFGATVTGRNAPVAGIEAMMGPTIATVPVRVRVRGKQTVSSFLESLQQQATAMMAHEQTGLQRIAKMGAGARHACSFQTLLVVQPAGDDLAGDGTLGEWRSSSGLQDFTTFALMLQCTLAAKGVHITASFDARVVERWLVEKMLGQLSFVIRQLAAADAETKVADIDMLTLKDKHQLWEWNAEAPTAVKRCIHDLFAKQAAVQPDEPAICAWDGEMTYGELDALSTRLASHLVKLGVKAENVVPLCFEKSMWTVVAMLAVLKAGGAFLLLDPSLPHERLRLMCSKSSSTLSLASPASAPVVQELVRSVVIVTRESVLQTPQHTSWTATAQPTDTAYVIFTSGSTGEPKGCRIEHRSSCSAVVGHGYQVEMRSSTRTLQFGSYAFAGSLVEILLTLVHGGCVCIPSEEERTTSLASPISRMNVNWAFLTSTVLDLLSPQSVPSLSTLCVGGEAILASQIAQWEGQVHLRQTYGSSETSGVVSSQRLTSTSLTGDVGKASTGAYWIVDSNDHSKLAPVGAVGEVLVEGPVLGREYIDEPGKTLATFIEAPAWRASFGEVTSQLRLYKTGDLARYKTDGSIELLGRKDSQVKLRGQRIELGEIEHQARLASSEIVELAVELIRSQEANSMLACFIVVDDNTDDQLDKDGKSSTLKARVQHTFQTVQNRLEQFLPRYMVPTAFIPVDHLPKTTSRKIDRKRLREIGASFSAQQLAEMQVSSEGPKRVPSTEAERKMQQLWTQVLNVERNSIGLDDSFFRLGGDSIAAMKLVGEARRAGIHLTAADVFRQPKLAQMCLTFRTPFDQSLKPTPPFSLLSSTTQDLILSESDLCKGAIQQGNVVDILPTTHMQRLIVKRGVDSPLEAFNYFFLDIRPELDVQSLRDSCQRLLDHFPILRTQFTLSQGKLWQIVLLGLRLPFTVFDVDGPLSEKSHCICLQDIHKIDPLGLPTSFMLVRNKSIGHRLIVRLSHAQYDGVCIPVIFRSLAALYEQETLLPTPGFSTYLAHAHSQRVESARYWRELLKDSHITNATAYLRPKASDETFLQNIKAERLICAPRLPKNITMASLLSSAWALVLSSITGEDDVVYGHLVAGRNSDIPGITEMVGPCLNIVPVRARTHSSRTPAQLIRSVHEQYISLGQSDAAQLDEIVQDCTDWPAGSEFNSVIQHQNIDEHPEFRFAGDTSKLQWFENPFRVAQQLFFASHPQADQLKLTIGGNTRMFTVNTAHLVLDMLAETIAALSTNLEGSLTQCKFPLSASS